MLMFGREMHLPLLRTNILADGNEENRGNISVVVEKKSDWIKGGENTGKANCVLMKWNNEIK